MPKGKVKHHWKIICVGSQYLDVCPEKKLWNKKDAVCGIIKIKM